MSSERSYICSDASYDQYEDQYEEYTNYVETRKYEIERLTQLIKIKPNYLILYKQKAYLLQTQAKYLQGLDKFKLQLDLLNCLNQIIQQSPQINEQDFDDDSYEIDDQENQYRLYSDFENQTLAEYIKDRINAQNQINQKVQDAKNMIIKINQKLHHKPTNYQLYIEKAHQYLILAYQSLGKGQFFQELQKAFETFQTAILNNPNQQNFLLSKKQEFCEQILESLDIDSLEYLQIFYQIMLAFDEQTEVKKKSSQSIQEQKVKTLMLALKKYNSNLIEEKIKMLKMICENCICSILKLQNQNKRQEIQNLCLEAKVYMIFAKVFTENYKSSQTNNNNQFQLAQESFQKIIKSLNPSQSEFPNKLKNLQFKIQVYQDLIYWIDRNEDKIKFQELICQTQEQICNLRPQPDSFTDLINKLEQLNRMQNREDVEILNRILIVYDKMMQNSVKDESYFQFKRKEQFNQDCFTQQAYICERMAKQKKFMKQKEKYFCMALEYYEKASKQDIHNYELIIKRIKTIVQVSVELGQEKKWNKYYDLVLQTLKESSDLKIFEQFISDQFETILKRFSENEQQEIALKFFQLLNSICQGTQEQNLDLFQRKAHILEKMGDQIKNEQNQFYYTESLNAYDQAISIQNKNSVAVNNKYNLLIKLNRKFEALKLAKKNLFQAYLIEINYHQLLVETSNFREALILGRLIGRYYRNCELSKKL